MSESMLLDILEDDERFAEFVESLDPTPWCLACGAKRRDDRRCRPTDPMD